MTVGERVLEGVADRVRVRPRRFVQVGVLVGAPTAVAVVLLGRAPLGAGTVVAALAVLLVVLLAARRPGAAALVLVVLLPLQVPLLSLLYALGVPGVVLRPVGGLKEVLLAGLLVHAAQRLAEGRSRLTGLDGLVLALTALVGLYLVAPFAGELGDQPLSTRLLAARGELIGPLLLLAVRHAGFGQVLVERLVRCFLGAALVLAAFVPVELALADVWERLVVDVLEVPAYSAEVLGVPVRFIRDVNEIGGVEFVRAGSLLLSPLGLGFLLSVATVLALTRLLQRPEAGRALVLGGLAAALVLTGTRSAVLGALVATAVVLRLAVRERLPGRVLGVLGLATVGVALLPIADTLVLRSSAVVGGDERSTEAHFASTAEALGVLVSEPLGRGLGAVGGVGRRSGVDDALIAENAFVEVGNEVGLLGLVVVVALVVVLVRASVARADRFGGLGAAGAGVVVAVAVVGLFLQVLSHIPTVVVTFTLAGALLGADRTGSTAQSPALGQLPSSDRRRTTRAGSPTTTVHGSTS